MAIFRVPWISEQNDRTRQKRGELSFSMWLILDQLLLLCAKISAFSTEAVRLRDWGKVASAVAWPFPPSSFLLSFLFPSSCRPPSLSCYELPSNSRRTTARGRPTTPVTLFIHEWRSAGRSRGRQKAERWKKRETESDTHRFYRILNFETKRRCTWDVYPRVNDIKPAKYDTRSSVRAGNAASLQSCRIGNHNDEIPPADFPSDPWRNCIRRTMRHVSFSLRETELRWPRHPFDHSRPRVSISRKLSTRRGISFSSCETSCTRRRCTRTPLSGSSNSRRIRAAVCDSDNSRWDEQRVHVRIFAGNSGTSSTSSVDSELRWSSGALEIRETAAAGKHAVAAAEIHPGDILTVEPPLAGCLLPEFYGTHCQHCYTRWGENCRRLSLFFSFSFSLCIMVSEFNGHDPRSAARNPRACNFCFVYVSAVSPRRQLSAAFYG